MSVLTPSLRARAVAVVATFALLGGAGTATAAAPVAGVDPSAAAARSSLPAVSAFAKDVSTAPLNAQSRAMVANLSEQVSSRYNGVAAFNVWKYGTSVVEASASQPRVDVRFDDCQKKGYTPASLYGSAGPFEDVPIPADAVPAAGSDGQLTVYSPSTDQLWELWKARRTSSGWSACWGGRIDRVSQSPGFFSGNWGASASGLALSMGTVRTVEAKAGRIDHALTLSLPLVGSRQTVGLSYPAQRSDGRDTRPAAIPMGTRFRLDPSVDVEALGLHPVAAAVARAAQRYGFVVSDTGGAVSVRAESGDLAAARTGVNPWYSILDGTGSYAVMKGFPWDRLQALPRDWGK